MTVVQTTGTKFGADIRHPCRGQFYIDGVPVTEHGTFEGNDRLKVTAIAAHSIAVEALEPGVDVEVRVKIICPGEKDKDAIPIADQYIPPDVGSWRAWIERIRRWLVFPFWLLITPGAWVLGGEKWVKHCTNNFPFELGGDFGG